MLRGVWLDIVKRTILCALSVCAAASLIHALHISFFFYGVMKHSRNGIAGYYYIELIFITLLSGAMVLLTYAKMRASSLFIISAMVLGNVCFGFAFLAYFIICAPPYEILREASSLSRLVED